MHLPLIDSSSLGVAFDIISPLLAPTVAVLIEFPISSICHTDIANLISDLHPFLTARGDRADSTQEIIGARGDKEAAEEVEVVNVCRTLGDGLANCADESDNVDKDTADIRGIPSPVEAKGEHVRRSLLGGIKIADLVVAFANDVVIADNYTGDGGEEHGVGGEVGGKVVGGREEVPWAHDETNQRADVPTSADIEIARKEGGHVRTSRDRVGCDVGAELGKGKGGGDDENTEARGAIGCMAVIGVDQEEGQEVQRVPDGFIVNDSAG